MHRYFLSAILLLSVVTAEAQTTQPMVNSGNITIHNSGSVTAFGNFSNTSAAGMVNNGTLSIRGNITNDQASMSAGAGMLNISGTAAQSINGGQQFNVFNLTTNNSAGITLNNNLSVAAAHTFTAGLITSSATPNYLIYQAGSSYTGSADNAHVNGWVRKLGSTNFLFPVGNNSYLRPVALSTLSTASVFNVNYAGLTQNTANVALPLVTVDTREFWWINQVSGGTAQVNMNWDNSKVTFPDYPLGSIRVAHYTGGFWTNQGGNATGNVYTTGAITSNTVSGFGAYTFGSLNTALPLHFISITAKRQTAYTRVHWRTEEEYNVDHFEVERNDNNTGSFYHIGNVAAYNGTVNEYEFDDKLPLDGTAFYRVKSIDRDGKFEYSKVVAVSDKINRGLTILNNPARNIIFIGVNNLQTGNYRYELIDAGGKNIQAGLFVIEGQSTLNISLSSKIVSGTYVLKISNNKFDFAEKIIIQ